MNDTQKTVLGGALICLGLTAAFAPYRVTGYNRYEAYLSNGERGAATTTVYAPVWNAPSGGAAAYTSISDVQLDSGKLAIWWGAIAIVAGGAIALAAGKREAPHTSRPNPHG